MAYTTEGNFDTTKGCIGQTTLPAIIGDRPTDGSGDGSSVFLVKSGERYGSFTARNVGNGLFRVKGVVDDIEIRNVEAENVYRVLELDTGATLNNFLIEKVRLQDAERSLARLRGNSGPGVIRQCWADLGGQRTAGDPFQMVIHLDEGCHDILIEDVEGRNAWASDKYGNGDIFCSEGGTSNLIFRRTMARGARDGGYDLKGRGHRLESAAAEDCGKSLRCWCPDLWADTFTTRRATRHHINILNCSVGGRTGLTIEHLVMESNNPNIAIISPDANQGADVLINSWEIVGEWPSDQIVVKVQSSGTKISWGPQGKPPGRYL